MKNHQGGTLAGHARIGTRRCEQRSSVGGLGLLPDDLGDPVHLTGLPGRVLKTWSSLPSAVLVDHV